jgi:hypothetical protein
MNTKMQTMQQTMFQIASNLDANWWSNIEPIYGQSFSDYIINNFSNFTPDTYESKIDFSSNTAQFASNTHNIIVDAASNWTYGSNTASWTSNSLSNYAASNRQSNWNYGSNTAQWASNEMGIYDSNWNYGSNTALWLSNNRGYWTSTSNVTTLSNVGIGTLDPLDRLHVNNGQIQVSGTYDYLRSVAILSSNTRGAILRNDATNIYIMGTSNNLPYGSATGYRPFIFNMSTGAVLIANGTIYAADPLTTGGQKVGIGTTSPSYLLHVNGDAAKTTGTSWTSISDERLKENIALADIDTCYSNVKNVPLKKYSWKCDVLCDEECGFNRDRIGWIAQDVELVFPKSVKKRQMHGYDDCRDLNVDELYASMYGAIQKMQQMIESAQTTIVGLESSLSSALDRIAVLENASNGI